MRSRTRRAGVQAVAMTVERTVAGHRVLRLLARGERSLVWLAADGLALKVLNAPVPTDQPGREAEALHRARGEHVVELLGVSIGADGVVLVFPRLPRGSLADLLIRRATLDAGEAVTVLAPIAACLARMHAAGVAHASLGPGSILFRRDGAPMLTGFGEAELFEPGLAEVRLERVAGVAADRAALLGIADAVLARTTGSRGKVAGRLREELRATPPDQLAGRMTAELFELAAARPVRFDPDASETGDEARRVVPVGEPVQASLAPEPVGPLAWVDRLLSTGPVTTVRDAVLERWTGWSAQRRRAVIGSAAAALALVVAISVVPGAPPAGETPVTVPTQAADVDDAATGETTEADAAVAGDDPLAALRELVARRDRCFRELSMLCLEGVDESGSSALDADRTALRAVLDGGVEPSRLVLTSAVLVERLGDSALVELSHDSDPASVLLLKGEAGWRIRDYLAGAGSEEAK
jgi:hypothetical protein